MAKVVLLMGPTAAGKTALALWLAERLPLEIISVDSVMVYRGLDIGSGKPSPAVLSSVPHHLINLSDPSQVYTTAQFRTDACKAIQTIHAQGKLALLVGGTMLYFRALRCGLAALPSADPEMRLALTAEAALHGWPALHERLRQLDPVTAARLHPNDAQRIQRALEVCQLSGQPLAAQLQAQPALDFPYDTLALVLAPANRAVLAGCITTRWQQMLDQGLIAEVQALRARGDLHLGLPAMRAVGYRQVWEYLDGMGDAAHMQARALAATRQLAKRQYTWLRQEQTAHWLSSSDPAHPQQALAHIQQMLA